MGLETTARRRNFGNGNIVSIEGNDLTVDFDKAGQKGSVERV